MKRRITAAIVGVTAFVLLALGIPLAIVVQREIVSSRVIEVQAKVAAALAEVAVPIDTTQLDALASDPDAPPPFSVYDGDGRLVFGDGPAVPDGPTSEALAGQTSHSRTDSDADGDIVVAMPISDKDDHVVGAIRMVDPKGGSDARVRSAWAVMALSGAIALLVAWLIARRLARQLTAPIERLAIAATDLGSGNAPADLPASGVDEIDAVADALSSSSTRIAEALARERRFSADVSHQLRTPLAGMRLKLEAPHATAQASSLAATTLEDLDRVDVTVTHLLAVARDATPHAEPSSVDDVIDRAGARWQATITHQGRHAQWRAGTERMVTAAGNSIDQIVDVLIDNALRHGEGDLTIAARPLGNAVAIDVTDSGSIPDEVTSGRLFERGEGEGHGIGLALARSLATAEGGRLLLTSRHPTTFTLFVPASVDTDP
jgi:signal transduction histidine kinase